MAVGTLALVQELETSRISWMTAADASRVVVELEAGHGQALFGFVRRQGLSDEEARDAVQEVLLRLWRELEGGAAVDNPRAWAYRAIYRLAMDQHRLARRVRLLVERLETGWGESADPARSLSDRVTVWAEVDQLPLRQRQVLYLRFRSDLPYEEIAATLGITASAARSHATQAVATLKRRLDTEDIR